MLKVIAQTSEMWDEAANQFIVPVTFELELEHSLVSVSKWESKWEKPYIDSEKSDAEALDYVRCMNMAPNVPPEIFDRMSQDTINEITAYINAKMTATWFTEEKAKPGRKEVITSEIIYYWMIALNIPPEFETWHLNRLITLIRVCNQKNAPAKKSTQSKADMAADRRRLNAQRKAKYNTSG